MYRRRGREPSKKWKHKTPFILKDLMFTPSKTLTLCFNRYNFSDVRVLEGVNIKSLSTNDVLCFHFLEGSRPLLRYIGWYRYENKSHQGPEPGPGERNLSLSLGFIIAIQQQQGGTIPKAAV